MVPNIVQGSTNCTIGNAIGVNGTNGYDRWLLIMQIINCQRVSHIIQYCVLNFRFINFTNNHCFYHDDNNK